MVNRAVRIPVDGPDMPTGYSYEHWIRPTGLPSVTIYRPDGREVANANVSEAGRWKAEVRGRRMYSKTPLTLIRRICANDAQVRATLGSAAADTLISIMGLHGDPRRLHSNSCLGDRLAARICESQEIDPPEIAAILRPLIAPALSWNKHITGGRLNPFYDGRNMREMTGEEVADIFARMADDGIGNVGEGERWFQSHAHKLEPEPHRGVLF